MEQSLAQNLIQLVEKVLDRGIVINGEIEIDKLTLTSVETAQSLGLTPQKRSDEEKSSQQQQSMQKQSPQDNQIPHSSQENAKHEQTLDMVSRDEFAKVVEELDKLKSQLENTQGTQQGGSSRGGK